jgi:hypothetical protein
MFYIPGDGSVTLSQVLTTVVGKTYTVSADYVTWISQTGNADTLTCAVNNAAANSWPLDLSVATGAPWHTFSGSFVATSTSTTFTCTAATASGGSYLWVNMDLFSVMC